MKRSIPALLLCVLALTACTTKKIVALDPNLQTHLEELKTRDETAIEAAHALEKDEQQQQAKAFLSGKKVTVPALGMEARPISGTAAIEAAVKAYDVTGEIDPIITGVNQISFPYGLSQPKLACSKLRVCSIGLQAGEQVLDMVTGDSQRWNISVARTGGGSQGQRPLIMVKPLSEGALATNLVITTDRRVYQIDMVSVTTGPYTPHIEFFYPHDTLTADSGVAPATDTLPIPASDRSVKQKSLPTLVSLGKMQFGYRIEGDTHLPWYPARVFDDGSKVFIQMNAALTASEVPVFLIQHEGKQEIVNYRYTAPYYVVDRLFDEGILILGTDKKQELVTITKVKGRHHG